MGWTLTGCQFRRGETPVPSMARGNNAAWICDDENCGRPILFVYRGIGGRLGNPVICECERRYFLVPEFERQLEPARGNIQRPAAIMQIEN